MGFNAITRAKSYQYLHKNKKDYFIVYSFFTGVACLSSVRAVKFLVHSLNERNSYSVLLLFF